MTNFFTALIVGFFGIIIISIWMIIHLWYVIIPLVICIIIWYLYYQHRAEMKTRQMRLQTKVHFQYLTKQKEEKRRKEEQRKLRKHQEKEKRREKIQREKLERNTRSKKISLSDLEEFLIFARNWRKRMEKSNGELFRN